MVTARSQASATGVVTVVMTVVELLEERVEVAVIGEMVSVAGTFTTMMMSTDAPEARVGSVQVTEVVVTQVHPAGAETEANVVLAGIGSVKLTPVAAAGPLLVIA